MIKWSATRINVANYCRMRYYLNYVDSDKPKPLRLSAYVRGSLLHALIDNFWDKLGTPDEVAKKSSGKKYHDAESFSNYSQGKWKRIIIADKKLREEYATKELEQEAERNEGRLINWKFDGEAWQVNGTLPRICVPLFDYLMKEGKPEFSELPFDFVLGNRRFTGRMDDIRKRDGKVVIRDYKSGNPWVGDMKSFFDPQLTMYNVGLCSLCKHYPEIAERLGLEKQVVETFMGHPNFIHPDFVVEFFMIDALGIDANNPKIKTMPNVVVASDRKNEHFEEVLKMIIGTEEAVTAGNIYPERGRKCDSCDLKYACAKKLELVGTDAMIDKAGQEFFNFAMPAFLRKEPTPEFKATQRKLRLRSN